ncbi:hypothetical protein ABVF54_10500 [Enterococcus mundtii]|uniref:Thiol-disulfide isomerase and thioredoxins n=1 Tax=Enterococcus mundtii TaxID=53346 RepID=A0AAI8WF56_ENTMU|nr:hypothetical protein [Enterococcus mundtii]BBM16253.1 thiol-disulfide isomerase and thioredoxins [Enterococcus mundtii]
MTEIQILLAFMRQSKRKSIKRSSLERWFETNDYWIKERQLKLFQQLQRSKVLRIMENGEIIRVEAMQEYFMLFDYMQTQRKSQLAKDQLKRWIAEQSAWHAKKTERLIRQLHCTETMKVTEFGVVISHEKQKKGENGWQKVQQIRA